MKMKALYAALSGAFLLGAATLCPAQTTNTATGDNTTPSATTMNHSSKANAGAKDEARIEAIENLAAGDLTADLIAVLKRLQTPQP